LFSLENCLKCLKEGSVNGLMDCLPWALQQEVLRNPGLSQNEHLEKGTLNFELLMHYFHSFRFPHDREVSQRFSSQTTRALTFAENPGWLCVLNSALIPLDFIISGNENSSFSSSHGDDRFTLAIGIISQATVMMAVMRDLSLSSDIRRRENVGGTIMGKGSGTFSAGLVSTLCHALRAQACLPSTYLVDRSSTFATA
jgi:hypothetical protein